MFEPPRINEEERRAAILRIGHILIELKNDLAYLPGGVPDSRIRKVMRYCIPILKEFQVKTLNLEYANECLDVYPLACLYNFGVQIIALREIQNRLRIDIHHFNHELRHIQAGAPEYVENLGVILAEAHEFIIFATIANRIHPSWDLTELSIAHAVKKAQGSQFLKEASHVVSILKAAFSIQEEELAGSKTSGPRSTHTISDGITPPYTALVVARDWYISYALSMSRPEREIRQQAQLPILPLRLLLTWFINSRRRVLVGTPKIGPELKELTGGVIARIRCDPIKNSNGTSTGSTWENPSPIDGITSDPTTNGDGEPNWEEPITLLINSFLIELGELSALFPVKEFPIHPVIQIKSPIHFEFQITGAEGSAINRVQRILKVLYGSYKTTAYCCLEIVQRAHWLDVGKKRAYAIRAKQEIEKNYLRAVGVLMATQRLNKEFFTDQRISRRYPTIKPLHNPFRCDLLDIIFEFCKDPNMAEEEYLTEITGMNINQVHSWFLYRRNVYYRPEHAELKTPPPSPPMKPRPKFFSRV